MAIGSTLSRVFGFQVTKSVDMEGLKRNPADPYSSRIPIESALQIPALWRALNIISDDVAGVPFRVYKSVDGDSRVRALEHRAYSLIRDSYDLRHHMQLLAGVYGNSYARVWRDGYGPVNLEPLPPFPHTFPVIEGTGPNRRKLILTDHYNTRGAKNLKALDERDVIHIRGLSLDGVTGLGAVEALSIALSGAVSVQRYVHLYFDQGGNVKGYVKLPGKLQPGQIDDIRNNWSSITAGLENSHKVGVLYGGAEYQETTQNAEESQLVEARRATIYDISNMTGVRPHDLGDTSGTGYNGLEQENRSHLKRAIGPWLDRWQTQADGTLLLPSEKAKRTHRCRFDRERMVEVGVGEQANADAKDVASHIVRPNEIRKRRNMPAMPGGDDFPKKEASGENGSESEEVRRKNGRADSDR